MLIGKGVFGGSSIGGGAAAVLTLNALLSSRTVFGGSTQAGVRTQVDGDVAEINFSGSWVSQNSGVEWVDDGGDTAGDYEVQLTGTGDTPSGRALTTWWTCDAQNSWTLTQVGTGFKSFSGTMTIREKADTGNSVSASVTIYAEVEAA